MLPLIINFMQHRADRSQSGIFAVLSRLFREDLLQALMVRRIEYKNGRSKREDST
jgi:hypothetical protein